ncbi:MAG: hypothetical protein NUV77_24965, partial [Thermoguttaceae bacterium]|nr:hypothetical protein [Thermoguttaceae bacterium]
GRGLTRDLVNTASQAQLASLQAAIEKALAQGVQYGKPVSVGGWELILAPPPSPGQLPVLIHALQK